MAFYETPVFPDYLAYGLIVGPAFTTTVVRVQSGVESRNQIWEFDLRAFDGTTTHRTPKERNAITAFFLAMRGRLHGFRIRDISDYKVEAGEGVVGAAIGSPSSGLQLMRRYTSGALTYDKPVFKPRSPIVLTGGGSYTVDYATGVVLYTGSPPTGWTGTYDLPARFDHDELPWEVAAPHGNDKLYIATQMRIVETRDFV